MAEPGRPGSVRTTIRVAQLLLVVAAGGLWAASRLPWVSIRSDDGLGPPRTVTLSGATWSTALLPMAMVALAAVVAAVAVRGWALRVLAGLLSLTGLAAGYLAISLWAVRDVAVRASDLADVAVPVLPGHRHYTGSTITLAAAMCTVVAAALLVRSAASGRAVTAKYAARGALTQTDIQAGTHAGDLSDRMIWDALDQGRDPTDTEGR